jgi:hypothetical protein
VSERDEENGFSSNNNIFKKQTNDENESIEKSYDSRRVPKAAGRGGAWYVVFYSLVTASGLRVGTGNGKEKLFIINV